MRVNIDQHRFLKRDVLKLVPGLSAKTFENWSENGLIRFHIEGRKTPRLLSAVDVIKLAAMFEAVEFGVRPSSASDLAEKIAPRIYEFGAALPDFPEGKRQTLVLPTTREVPIFYACFEVDVLLGQMFTRIFHHIAQERAAPPARKSKSTKRKK